MSFKIDVLGKVRFGNELEDILKLKGITDINSFLNPTIENTESELRFDNIEAARDILVNHISNNSVIDLLVDCDCDGYTSGANIYQYIKRIKPSIEIRCFIHRGKIHGLKDVVDSMLLDNSKLVIIPDAGSGDVDECKKLKESGKEVIILDHHNIRNNDNTIPNNSAVVVNNQYSSRVTDKAMTGVGITYKFTKLLDKYYGVDYADEYLDVVALGMIGDRADTLNLQTRYLILKGLEQIKSMFEALCNSDKMLERKVKGKGMVNMTIQEYVLKACQSTNRKQKKITEESADILSEEIKKYGMDKLPILVCNARDDVDSNSTGLIANRLADQYQRPCLLMRRKGDICKGSGRGCDKCEILDFNKWCKDTGLFNMVDGHPGAFGCEISFENTNKLFQLLSTMDRIDEPTYHVYNIYDADKLHDQIIKNVAKYDYIWGNTVQEPIFFIKNIPCNKYNLKGVH